MGFESFPKKDAAQAGTIEGINFNEVSTTEELTTAVQNLDEGDGYFTSDAGAGKLSVERTIESIRSGYGENVSDSRVQRAAIRIKGLESPQLSTKVDAQPDFESITDPEELIKLVEGLDEGDGYFTSDAGAGKLSVERTIESIRSGYGENVSDSRVQRAAIRIKGN